MSFFGARFVAFFVDFLVVLAAFFAGSAFFAVFLADSAFFAVFLVVSGFLGRLRDAPAPASSVGEAADAAAAFFVVFFTVRFAGAASSSCSCSWS